MGTGLGTGDLSPTFVIVVMLCGEVARAVTAPGTREVPPLYVPAAMLVSAVLVLLLLLVLGMGRWGRGLFLFPSTLNVEDFIASFPLLYGQTLLVVSSSTSCADAAGCNLRASFRFSASRLSSS